MSAASSRLRLPLCLCTWLAACVQAPMPAHAPVPRPPPSAADAELHVPASLATKMRHTPGYHRPRPAARSESVRGLSAERQPRHVTPCTWPGGTCSRWWRWPRPTSRTSTRRSTPRDGDLLAIDSEPDPHPTIQVCAQTPQDLYYVLQLYDGDAASSCCRSTAPRSSLAAAAQVAGWPAGGGRGPDGTRAVPRTR